jgi:uncharacterized membrane protein YgaE (UPF0421/DUF939 family)
VFGWKTRRRAEHGQVIRTAFFFALAAGLAFFVARKLHVDLGGLWVVLSAVTILKPKASETLNIARNQLLGTAVGVSLGAVFGLMNLPVAGVALAVFSTALVCSIPILRGVINISCVAAAIVILLPMGGPTYVTALHRFADTIIGAAIALLVAAMAAQSNRWWQADWDRERPRTAK